MYHDVTAAPGDSGFPRGDAALYKLPPGAFEKHLDAIRAVAPGTVLTFDDGGVSLHSCIAGMLEDRGWRAHFFFTTDWIGKPGFCNRDQIRELSARGHIVGSHSCSHPPRMSALALDEIEREWRRSVEMLEEIIGAPVTTASVPGGFYSADVARAAARAGIRKLFTSEPTARTLKIDGCLIQGRYAIQRGDSASRAAALAAGVWLPRFQQLAWWQIKKIAKRLGGDAYLKARQALLRG
jgi:peptidoglycan/xylan/chitin deacetylase (PgdA/CDA1 family)